MTINYLPYITDFTKCKIDYISGIYSLFDLLKALCEKYGALFQNNMLNSDMSNLNDGIVVLINGKNVALSHGINLKLQDDDTITFLPIVMGG